MDRACHDHVGHRFRRHGVRAGPDQLLCPALSAGRGRSRLFSRHHPLSAYWFPTRQRAAVTALFMAAAPMSAIFGSPLSAALLELHGLAGLKGWQWMFLLEAVPAVLLGFVVLVYMTDRPEKAKWLARRGARLACRRP